MARLTLPSRLELKRSEGSFREAPLAKVIFTTFLYVSPVQISPLCDQTGVPLHFHSSATSGSASLIRARSRESMETRLSSTGSSSCYLPLLGSLFSLAHTGRMDGSGPGSRGALSGRGRASRAAVRCSGLLSAHLGTGRL